MNPIILILVAMFSNFFGWFIVNKYCNFFEMSCASHPFNEYYFSESIFELIIIYIIILIIGFIFIKKQKKIQPKKIMPIVFYYKLGYWLLTAFIILNIIYNIIHINFNTNLDLRGVGQFNRDFSSSLARFSLLIFPIFILYRLAFLDKKSILISNIFLFTVLVGALATADRRILFYYILAFLMIKFYENGRKINFKNYFYILMIFMLLPLLYLRRFDGDFFELSKVMGFIFLQSSLGALGVSAILPEVKYIIVNETGFLNGKSFILYFLTLFVPSFLLYLFGGNEFYFRSSLYFDQLFNTNPNMGYDFMMVADFYWNFGYFGYFLYSTLVLLIFYIALVVRRNNNIKSRGIFIIIVVFFIAGQRSDFGLFLKSTFYSIILFYILYKILPKRFYLESES